MTTAAVFLALAFSTAAQTVPDDWTCDDALFADGSCDCGCDADDEDCATSEFADCVVDHCADGQVPWEHESSTCMNSTCGDGWKADDEACDDFDALAGGGCNADCSAVNEGFTCGERAEGCSGGAEGEGEGEGGGGDDDDDTPPGCSTTGTDASGFALAGALLLRGVARRRRSVRLSAKG